MSFTALVFLVGYVGGLALAFRHPVWGLAAYLWAFYNHPPSRWWGEGLPDIRWSLVAAAITLVAFAFARLTQGGFDATTYAHRPVHGGHAPRVPVSEMTRRTPLSAGFWLLAAFAAWMWMQTLWAEGPGHLDGCILFTKYVVLFFLVERLLDSERPIELFAWAHVGGCFLWGWLAYTGDFSGRAELNLGPGVADSNTLGFHLVTGLALGGLMLLQAHGVRRLIMLPVLPFIMNGVILTASRGAALAMAAAGVGALAFAPRMKKHVTWGGALLGLVLFGLLAGSELFWERMSTIGVGTESEMEASAYSRIETARANWQMFLDHPLGAGYRGNVALSPEYLEHRWLSETGERSAHNTFLAVLVDGGVPGFFLFLMLVMWAGFRLLAMKKLDKGGLPPSLGAYRGAVAGGLLAYVVAGQFGNYLTAEVGIWLLALVAALDRISAVAVPERVKAQTVGTDPNSLRIVPPLKRPQPLPPAARAHLSRLRLVRERRL